MAVTTDEPVDLDRLEHDAEQRLSELRERQRTLALDALSDPRAAKQLQTVESDVAVCERTLSQARLARVERARREQAATEERATEAREAALAEARDLQLARTRAARSIDSSARRLASAIKDWRRIGSEQSLALARAGRDGGVARSRDYLVELAVAHQMRAAGLPRGVLRLEALGRMGAAHIKPLTDSDPVAIEPTEDK